MTYSSYIGSLLLTARMGRLDTQTINEREYILLSWGKSSIPPLRLLQRQLVMLAKQTWIKVSPTLRPVLGFPRVPVNFKMGDCYKYDFIQLPPGKGSEVMETDVVIVGSGCGGGVCAKVLAEAGLNVIVVDKGHFWSPAYLPMTEEQGLGHLFVNGGSVVGM
jgi:hypothetical protein